MNAAHTTFVLIQREPTSLSLSSPPSSPSHLPLLTHSPQYSALLYYCIIVLLLIIQHIYATLWLLCLDGPAPNMLRDRRRSLDSILFAENDSHMPHGSSRSSARSWVDEEEWIGADNNVFASQGTCNNLV